MVNSREKMGEHAAFHLRFFRQESINLLLICNPSRLRFGLCSFGYLQLPPVTQTGDVQSTTISMPVFPRIFTPKARGKLPLYT